jgi:hypothetical protein
MLFRSALLYALVGFTANQVAAAAVEAPRDMASIQAPSIATDRGTVYPIPDQSTSHIINTPRVVSACNCPNNCSHKQGSSCKFYSGPSDTSKVISGRESTLLKSTISAHHVPLQIASFWVDNCSASRLNVRFSTWKEEGQLYLLLRLCGSLSRSNYSHSLDRYW